MGVHPEVRSGAPSNLSKRNLSHSELLFKNSAMGVRDAHAFSFWHPRSDLLCAYAAPAQERWKQMPEPAFGNHVQGCVSGMQNVRGGNLSRTVGCRQ